MEKLKRETSTRPVYETAIENTVFEIVDLLPDKALNKYGLRKIKDSSMRLGWDAILSSLLAEGIVEYIPKEKITQLREVVIQHRNELRNNNKLDETTEKRLSQRINQLANIENQKNKQEQGS